MITVKKSGLGILNPVMSENKKYLSSQRAITELIPDVTREGAFYNSDCLLAPREESNGGQKNQDDVNDAKLKV